MDGKDKTDSSLESVIQIYMHLQSVAVVGTCCVCCVVGTCPWLFVPIRNNHNSFQVFIGIPSLSEWPVYSGMFLEPYSCPEWTIPTAPSKQRNNSIHIISTIHSTNPTRVLHKTLCHKRLGTRQRHIIITKKAKLQLDITHIGIGRPSLDQYDGRSTLESHGHCLCRSARHCRIGRPRCLHIDIPFGLSRLSSHHIGHNHIGSHRVDRTRETTRHTNVLVVWEFPRTTRHGIIETTGQLGGRTNGYSDRYGIVPTSLGVFANESVGGASRVGIDSGRGGLSGI